MPDVAELDRAVDALLDTPLVAPTEPSVLMRRARGHVRRRRAGAAAVVAVVGAAALTVALVAHNGSSPVRIGTRPAAPVATSAPTATSEPAPIAHVSADSQFDATVLPAGVALRELAVFPAQDGGPAEVLADYSDDTVERISIFAYPIGPSQTPDAALAQVHFGHFPGGLGAPEHTTLDGRPALIGSDVERPDTPFVAWAVDGTVLELGGQNGTPVDQLIQVALGLRPASVSQPPGIYVVRDGVLTRQ